MSRLACTFLLTAALPVLACSKNTESAAGAPTPSTSGASASTSDLATAAGLTNMLTSKLGISETQATAAVGSVLSLAKGQLSPKDYGTLSTAIPGAESFLSAAPDVAVAKAPDTIAPPAADSTAAISIATTADSTPAAGLDAATAGANAAAAASQSVGMSALNSAFSKIGLPPQAATQFVPVLTDYVGKVGGPEAANILKGLF